MIGPGGVFVLNTKRHRQKTVAVGTHVVWINGTQENDYQRNLLRRTASVRELLGLEGADPGTVRPLLVFADTRQLTTRGDQTVGSVKASLLVEHLLAQPALLSPERALELFAAAERPRTWGRPASVLHEPDPMPRFLQLVPAESVRRAPASWSVTPRAVHPSAAGRRRPTRRRTPTPPPPAFRGLVLRLLAGVLAITLAPLAAVLGASIFAALMQALLPH